MRINQLPVLTQIPADTDVLALETNEKTYQVPMSVINPTPWVGTIPTSAWSGSGSDYYITVQASNVTADSILIPHYDKDSADLLTGTVWSVPGDGSFTVHTAGKPTGTVTIMVQFIGVMGEAQYQVLEDVYTKSQVDELVEDNCYLSKGVTTLQRSICSGYITGSGNYINFFIPVRVKSGTKNISVQVNTSSSSIYTSDTKIDFPANAISVVNISENGITVEAKFDTTQSSNKPANVIIIGCTITYN